MRNIRVAEPFLARASEEIEFSQFLYRALAYVPFFFWETTLLGCSGL